MSAAATPFEAGYPVFARIIHWLVVGLMIAMFFTGFVGYGGANSQPWPGKLPVRTGATASAPAHAWAPPAGAPAWRPPAGPRKGDSPWSLNQMHKSLGLIVLALTGLRLAYRAFSNYPPVGANAPRYMVIAAKSVQGLIYGGLVLQPLIGVIGSGRAFMFLGLFKIPSFETFRPMIPQLHTAHIYVAWTLLVLISLHASAALFHHYVLKDGVLRAMVLGRR